ncbi:MAG: hypothetical protein WCB68_23935 [Pyrinomonadaceae bacterium]
MRLKSLACYTLLLLLIIPHSPVNAREIKTRRINFKRGQTSASVRGSLRGMNEMKVFLVRAKAGQHMRVEIVGDGATVGYVTAPSGKQEGMPGGVVFDDELKETGDYRLLVKEHNMAEGWRGHFILKVEVR